MNIYNKKWGWVGFINIMTSTSSTLTMLMARSCSSVSRMRRGPPPFPWLSPCPLNSYQQHMKDGWGRLKRRASSSTCMSQLLQQDAGSGQFTNSWSDTHTFSHLSHLFCVFLHTFPTEPHLFMLKGTVARDFQPLVFSKNRPHIVPEFTPPKIFLNSVSNSRKYSYLKLFCGVRYPAELCSVEYHAPLDVVLRGIRPRRTSVCCKIYTSLSLFCGV
jgi:hypothetical protein